MYIDTVPNRNSPPCILLRESYRKGGKVHKNTIANLTKCAPELIDGMRTLLRGGKAVKSIEKAFRIAGSKPHGHAAAVLSSIRRLGLDSMIASRRNRFRASSQL